MKSIIMILALLTLSFSIAQAGILDESAFAGVTPFTFDGYDLPWADQDVSFGGFSIAGSYDSYAYQMPFVSPVVAPAIGADTITITFDPAVDQTGFHMGTQWGGIAVRFYGAGDVLLGDFLIEDFVAEYTGPNGYGFQGFVGFSDDSGTAITKVMIGSGDHYIDNLYAGSGTVANQPLSMDHLKSLYR